MFLLCYNWWIFRYAHYYWGISFTFTAWMLRFSNYFLIWGLSNLLLRIFRNWIYSFRSLIKGSRCKILLYIPLWCIRAHLCVSTFCWRSKFVSWRISVARFYLRFLNLELQGFELIIRGMKNWLGSLFMSWLVINWFNNSLFNRTYLKSFILAVKALLRWHGV